MDKKAVQKKRVKTVEVQKRLAQPKQEGKPKHWDHVVFAALVLIVLAATGALLWSQQHAQPATVPLFTPKPITGKVVAVEKQAPTQTPPETVAVAALVSSKEAYDGKVVVVEGVLGHRSREGYGWNLKFDLFDAEGNSIRLNGVDPSTETNARYRATGKISAEQYGPEMEVNKLEKLG